MRFYSSINCYLKRIFLVGHSVTCYRVLFFIQSTFCKVIFVTWRQIQTECRRKLDTFIVTFQRPASPSCLLSSPFSPFVPFILFLPPSPFPSVLSLNPISNSLYIFHSLFFSILRQSPSLPIKTRHSALLDLTRSRSRDNRAEPSFNNRLYSSRRALHFSRACTTCTSGCETVLARPKLKL